MYVACLFEEFGVCCVGMRVAVEAARVQDWFDHCEARVGAVGASDCD